MASTIYTNRNYLRPTNYTTTQNPYYYPNNNINHFFLTNTHHHRSPVHHNRQPVTTTSNRFTTTGYRFITYRISSFTKHELKTLKTKLVSDLNRVRVLSKRVGSKPVQRRIKVKPKTLKPMKNECSEILVKLMKHKHGWVFNTPVDAAALGLYDYHNVIINPMDLGTIKLKLVRNEYDSPLAFAADVRLTFRNAMVYNGKDSDVYVMAERLLLLFEDLFGSMYEKRANGSRVGVSEKREMTDKEKSELAASFGDLKLGREGMDEIVGILKRGVSGLEQHTRGNEVEIDLAVLDDDTLWELRRFVCSKRKELLSNMISSLQTGNYAVAGNEKLVEEGGKMDGGEKDIDIGEVMPSSAIPKIEINEKDTVNISSCSESSFDSDSSFSGSGLGSGTCSGNSYNEFLVNSTPKMVP